MTIQEQSEKLEDNKNWYENRGYDIRDIKGGFEVYIDGLKREKHTLGSIETWGE